MKIQYTLSVIALTAAIATGIYIYKDDDEHQITNQEIEKEVDDFFFNGSESDFGYATQSMKISPDAFEKEIGKTEIKIPQSGIGQLKGTIE